MPAGTGCCQSSHCPIDHRQRWSQPQHSRPWLQECILCAPGRCPSSRSSAADLESCSWVAQLRYNYTRDTLGSSRPYVWSVWTVDGRARQGRDRVGKSKIREPARHTLRPSPSAQCTTATHTPHTRDSEERRRITVAHICSESRAMERIYHAGTPRSYGHDARPKHAPRRTTGRKSPPGALALGKEPAPRDGGSQMDTSRPARSRPWPRP